MLHWPCFGTSCVAEQGPDHRSRYYHSRRLSAERLETKGCVPLAGGESKQCLLSHLVVVFMCQPLLRTLRGASHRRSS